MIVLTARHLGMCFGVREAIQTAHRETQPGKVTIYGEIVHNPLVQLELARKGFRSVPETGRGNIPATEKIMVTAHGISNRKLKELARAGKRLIDTTCPLVRRIHRAAIQFRDEGLHIIVVGRREHVEVVGITGDLGDFSVVQGPDDVRPYRAHRLGVLSQSTTAPRLFQKTCQRILELNPGKEITIRDTICQPTRDRQQAVKELLDQVDALVVVGGRHSNNTNELGRLAEAGGLPWFRVSTATELPTRQLEQFQTVGLTAGTSTPDEVVRDVYVALSRLNSIPKGPVPSVKGGAGLANPALAGLTT